MIKTADHVELKQILSSVPPEKVRVIGRAPIVSDDFNQHILGSELAQLLNWKVLLSVKAKYIFSKALSEELLATFTAIEDKFYKTAPTYFSSEEEMLMSFMRALASWGAEVSVLIVEECAAFLDAEIKSVLFRCLSQLSDRVSIYWGLPAPLESEEPGKRGSNTYEKKIENQI